MADKIMMVSITEEDIHKGGIGDRWRCPLALAMSRAVGQPVLVGFSRYGDRSDGWLRPLPRKAVKWRRRFDADKKVCPISFPARVPEYYIKQVHHG